MDQPHRSHDSIRRGDIFWVLPDESRGSIPARAHPHVVVQDDVFNLSRLTTVVVCGLSTNAKIFNEPGNVLLQVGEANLSKQSVIVVSQISSVLKSQLGEYIGSLSAYRVDQALAGLRLQQDSFLRRATESDA